MAEATDREVRNADGWNVPTKNLPPMEVRDLPEPLPLGKIIGASVILLATALGSGELLIWPYITTQAGVRDAPLLDDAHRLEPEGTAGKDTAQGLAGTDNSRNGVEVHQPHAVPALPDNHQPDVAGLDSTRTSVNVPAWSGCSGASRPRRDDVGTVGNSHQLSQRNS